MGTDTTYIQEAIELARAAAVDGNSPYGSLLVTDDTVLERAKNTIMTDDDICAHPELKLARWAARELSPDERADCTMYTSTEPCEMCATAVYYAGLGRVVYSVSRATLAADQDESDSGIPCEEVIERKGGATDVVGPVHESEGLAVHAETR